MDTDSTEVKESRKRSCPFPLNIEEEEEERLLEYDPDDNVDNELGKDMDSLKILSDEENEDDEDENVNEKADEEPSEKKLKLREYQKELAELALTGENTIVCAETGAGKTRVAFYILQQHLLKNPNGRVAILAEKVVLVGQHYKALCRVLPELQGKILNMSGQSGTSIELPVLMQDYQVVILTPALIVNTLERQGPGSKFLSEFSLVIFDECHHTHKNTQYNRLMTHYHMEKSKNETTSSLPQIVGLTATLGTNKANSKEGAKSHILQVMANLDVRKLSTVQRNMDEYDQFCTHAKSEKYTLTESFDDPIYLVLKDVMLKIENKLKATREHLEHSQDEDVKNMIACLGKTISAKNDPSYIQWTTELQEKGSALLGKKPQVASMVKIGAMYLKILSETMEINEALRVTDAMTVLDKRMKRDHLGPYCNPNDTMENELMDITKDLRMNISSIAKEKNIDSDEERHINKLLKIIKEYYDEKQNDTRFMIFVKTREVGEALTAILNETGSTSRLFTGVSAGSDEGGTSQAEQQKITQMFLEGEIQGIVATTAAEEGLDIPDCNFVIQYNYVGNEISTRQSTGRIRKKGGKRVLLSKQKEAMRDTINNQRALLMHKALTDVLTLSQTEVCNRIKVNHERIVEIERRRRISKPEVARGSASRYKMICNKCGKFEIDCDQIRSIKGQHHAVIDPTIWRRIHIKPFPKGPLRIEGDIELQGELFGDTSHCKHKLGTASLYQTVRLPFISLKLMRVLDSVSKMAPKLPKWDKAPFQIGEISDEDLCKMTLGL